MRSFLLCGVALATLMPAAVQAQQAPAPTPPAIDATAAPQQEIVVTATPLRDQGASITAKVNRETILQAGGASIADALANTPGIAASGFAAGASRPIIRGMDATRVRMLEDGSSSSDVSDIGPDHGVPIDPLAAQSVEVVRGAGTLRYGSQAIGGVVNVLNNRVPLTLPTAPVAAEATGSYASVSDTGQGSLLLDGKVGDVALHADGFYRHAGDYDTPLGTQENSFFRGYGGSLGGSVFVGPDSHVGAAIIQYDAKYGIPSDTTYIDMRQTKLLTRSSIDLGSGLIRTLKIDGSYGKYAHDEDDPDGTVLTTFKNEEIDARAELTLGEIGPADQSALGVEVQHRDFSALGEDSTYLFPTTTSNVAAYLFTQLPVTSAFHLQASGRVEHVEETGTPRFGDCTTDSFTPVSAALGALLDIGRAVKLGITLASTGRAPAITELFARGGHDGPNTFETGDPDLGIERANSVEATVRVHSGRFHADGSVYASWFRNYIFGDLTGRTCDDDGVCTDGLDGSLRELNYGQQGAHFRGLEGQASYELMKGGAGTLEARAIGDYTRATLNDGGNVPRIPPYRLGGGLDWQGRQLDGGFILTYFGRQTKFGAFDTPTPSYVQLTAQVAWRPFKAHPGVELAVIGQNLTDDVQRDAASLNRNDVVLPGRNVRLVLKVATF